MEKNKEVLDLGIRIKNPSSFKDREIAVRELDAKIKPMVLWKMTEILKQNNGLAEDIYQDSLVKVITDIHKWNEKKGAFLGWCKTVFLREALMVLRHNWYKKEESNKVSLSVSSNIEENIHLDKVQNDIQESILGNSASTVSDVENTENLLEYDSKLQLVHEVLNGLTNKTLKDVLWLKYGEGLSANEIIEKIPQLNIQDVKNFCIRGKKMFESAYSQAYLKNYGKIIKKAVKKKICVD